MTEIMLEKVGGELICFNYAGLIEFIIGIMNREATKVRVEEEPIIDDEGNTFFIPYTYKIIPDCMEDLDDIGVPEVELKTTKVKFNTCPHQLVRNSRNLDFVPVSCKDLNCKDLSSNSLLTQKPRKSDPKWFPFDFILKATKGLRYCVNGEDDRRLTFLVPKKSGTLQESDLKIIFERFISALEKNFMCKILHMIKGTVKIGLSTLIQDDDDKLLVETGLCAFFYPGEY